MPATNPRLSITMQPSLAAVLRRLSQLTGNSQSALIADLLFDSLPVLERMAQVLEAAARVKAEGMNVPKEFSSALDKAQSRLEDQLGLVLEQMDDGTRPLLDQAERIGRRARRAEPAKRRTAPTPMSNRGVTPSPTKDRPAARKGVKRGAV